MLIYAVAATSILMSAGSGHDVRAHLSPNALDFFADLVPEFVPGELEIPDQTFELAQCESGPIVFHQNQTQIGLSVGGISIESTQAGRVNLHLDLSADIEGIADVEKAFVCVGHLTCNEHVRLDNVPIDVELEASLVSGEQPHLALSSLSVGLTESNFDFWLSDCSAGELANPLFQEAKAQVLAMVTDMISDMAAEQVSPLLADSISGYTSLTGQIGFAGISIEASELTIDPAGVTVAAEVDFFSIIPPSKCINEIPEPVKQVAQNPTIEAFEGADIGLAFELSLVEDLVFQVWRQGLICMTDQHLWSLGLEVDLAPLASLLPGFDPGTEFELAFTFIEPPRLDAIASDNAEIEITLPSVEASIIGTQPDGSKNTLVINVGLKARAALALDPFRNTLLAMPKGVEIEHLTLTESFGFDDERLREVVLSELVGPILEEMHEIALMSPIAGAEGIYLVPSLMKTTDSHLVVGANLFRPSECDLTAPDTTIDPIGGIVRAGHSHLTFSGTDNETPDDLIRYEVSLNGEVLELFHQRVLPLGTAGVTETVEVTVTALDLNDNRDGTTTQRTIIVDGVAPQIRYEGDVTEVVIGSEVEMRWQARDDVSPASALSTTLDVYRYSDPADLTSAVLIDQRQISTGANRAFLTLPEGEVYRIDLIVTDEAGNPAVTRVTYRLDAASGCHQAQLPILLAWLLPMGLVWRRRLTNKVSA